MNRKRNVSYIKPEDPEFLKVLKKQAGYDDRNHKFDELENADEDFVDDEDSEKPQIVVLKEGDLTSEEAELEKKRLEKLESEAKADLNQRVIFKSKQGTEPSKIEKKSGTNKKKQKEMTSKSSEKKCQLLSFADDLNDDDDAE